MCVIETVRAKRTHKYSILLVMVLLVTGQPLPSPRFLPKTDMSKP
jgi:hypothetical protein